MPPRFTLLDSRCTCATCADNPLCAPPPLQLDVAHTERLSSKRPLAAWRRLERQVELAVKEVKAAEQRAAEEQAAADEMRAQLQALGARCGALQSIAA